MRLKPRTIPIITFSSLIIASVLALTIFGSYTYLEWKEKNARRNYRLALYDLNAQFFNKYITANLQAKIDTDGIFKGRPVVWGTIRNASNKQIYSLKLKISFRDPEEHVIYVDTFYPIGVDPESLIHIRDIAKKTKNFLKEGDSISFTHQMKNCPPKLTDYLKSRRKFAKTEPSKTLELIYKIEGMDIK